MNEHEVPDVELEEVPAPDPKELEDYLQQVADEIGVVATDDPHHVNAPVVEVEREV